MKRENLPPLTVVTRETRAKDAVRSLYHTPFRSKLAALGDNPSPDKVAELLGPSAVSTQCDRCGDSHSALVVIGQAPDHESATAKVCLPCLKEAVATLERELTVPVNTILFTKDGRNIGNAIVVDISDGLVTVKTDYGNEARKLNLSEVHTLFNVGPVAEPDHKHFVATVKPS